MRKVISNGQTTPLWFDPWMAEGNVVELIGRSDCNITNYPQRRVSLIIQNNEWHL